jgi:hypothetical protein
MDSDFKGMNGGAFVDYSDRKYKCPKCDYQAAGYNVLQKSPPEFLLQPHRLYPMSKKQFNYWLRILKENFPDDHRLTSTKFQPYTASLWTRLWKRLRG